MQRVANYQAIKLSSKIQILLDQFVCAEKLFDLFDNCRILNRVNICIVLINYILKTDSVNEYIIFNFFVRKTKYVKKYIALKNGRA